MKRKSFNRMTALLLSAFLMGAVAPVCAQNANVEVKTAISPAEDEDEVPFDSTSIKSRQIGQWVITREYEETMSPDWEEHGLGSKSKSLEYHINYCHEFEPHFPIWFMGFSTLCNRPMEFWDPSRIEVNESRSWTWDIYPFQWSSSFGPRNTWGLTYALGFGRTQYRMAFDSYFYRASDLTTQFGKSSAIGEWDKVWFRYWTISIPVCLQWQKELNGKKLFIGAGPEVECRFAPACKGRMDGMKHKEVITKDLDMHPLGVSALVQVGYGDITLMARTGVPELFAKSQKNIYNGNDLLLVGSYIWPVTVGIGLTF